MRPRQSAALPIPKGRHPSDGAILTALNPVSDVEFNGSKLVQLHIEPPYMASVMRLYAVRVRTEVNGVVQHGNSVLLPEDPCWRRFMPSELNAPSVSLKIHARNRLPQFFQRLFKQIVGLAMSEYRNDLVHQSGQRCFV